MNTEAFDNLSDDELALLHWAGELPEAHDAAATGRLAAGRVSADLRDAFAVLDGRLTVDAAKTPLPPAEFAARRVVRAMHDRAAESAVEEHKRRRLRIPGWVIYPSAAAAVLALAMVGWWYKVHDEFAAVPQQQYPRDLGPPVLIFRGDPDANASDDRGDRSDFQINRQFDSMIVETPGGGEAERQLAALKFLEESVQ